MANKLIWGSDLYKGFKLDEKNLITGQVDDLLPFQMLTLEQKTIDWIKAVADYYEYCGWRNIEKKAGRIQKNYDMRYGKLTASDYIINPNVNPLSETIGMIVPSNQSQSPLEQFYSLVPNFVDVLRGEFVKMDNTWTIEAVDPLSKTETFDNKKGQFEQVILDFAKVQQQEALANEGLIAEQNPEEYKKQMETAMKRFREVELESKNFRTTGIQWAEKVLKIQEKRYSLHEIEPDAFESGLISDSEFWHLDLLDDDFKLEVLNPKWCDYHKGPNVKYVSDGDYFLWFNFMSAGDIVNKFGRKMKEEDILKMKEIYVKTANMLVTDQEKNMQGSYYDPSKSWSQATDLNPAMNDALLGKELAYSYMRSPNFDHNIEVDIFNPVWGRLVTGHPQMFRVMRLYWRSMKRIGFVTKINRDGTREKPTWVDEHYKLTVEPQYDNSITKDKTKNNLLYGEHIDWTWVNEWRHVMKISPNQKHTFWMNSQHTFQAIYIDGGPVPFQFKGRNNPFDSLPPVEGCSYSWINAHSHSFVDRLRPLQIIFNICMNKVPKKFLADYGNKVAIHRGMLPQNNLSNSTWTIDPAEEFEDKLRNSDIIDYSYTRESMEGMGQPPLPSVLSLSTAQEAQWYLQIADSIKWMAGEHVGITRQRLGGQKASETATGIQQGIIYSETQTQKYYEQHGNLMERVRQRMLDAAQYYSTFNETSRDMYMNDMNENVMLEIEGMDNLLPHYNINLQSKANVRSALQKISSFLENENTLPISPSAKLEALISTSIPHILGTIKKAELEQIQNDRMQNEYDMEMERQRIEAQQKMEADNRLHEDTQKQKDRETDIEVATIRALGGVQTDNNKNSEVDAMENLTPFFKQQELRDKRNASNDALELKKQIDTDKLIIEREKAQKKLEGDKYKADMAFKIAKENTRKKG